MDPKDATALLMQLRGQRLRIKDAKIRARGAFGAEQARKIAQEIPFVKGKIDQSMQKEDIIAQIETADELIRKRGWLLLITQGLIKIPIAKFLDKLRVIYYDDIMAKRELDKARGKGTVQETAKLRRIQEIAKKREKYERMVKHILLSNPEFLRNIKRKKNWLSKEKSGMLEKVAQKVVSVSVKEKTWLDEMRKRLGD